MAAKRSKTQAAATAAAQPPTKSGQGRWVLLAISAALLWSYWPTVVTLARFWQRNQDYSVGMLVPPVAAYLIWSQRDRLAGTQWQPSWLGVGLLLLVELGRLGGEFFGVGSADRYALVGAIGATIMAVMGWRIFWRLKWIILFLVLMVPLPARVHESIAVPLQSLATASAVFGLELGGFFVLREGNLLKLENGAVVGVAEACSGLRMLTAFVFVSAVLAFLVKRPQWQKAVLVVASIPIAVGTNCIRVIATSIVVYYSSSTTITETFHDAAGFAMMPLAIVACLLLLKFLALFETPPAPRPSNAARRRIPTHGARA